MESLENTREIEEWRCGTFLQCSKWVFLILSFFSPLVADGVCVFKCLLNRDTECCRVGKESVLITLGYSSALLKFESHAGKFCACGFSEAESPDWVTLLLLIGWLWRCVS